MLTNCRPKTQFNLFIHRRGGSGVSYGDGRLNCLISPPVSCQNGSRVGVYGGPSGSTGLGPKCHARICLHICPIETHGGTVNPFSTLRNGVLLEREFCAVG